MTTLDTSRYAFVIDPIRSEPVEEPEVTQALAHVRQALGLSASEPPPVTGWQLTLTLDGQPVAQRAFDGTEEGFQHAQDAGRAWLAQHGANSIDQWLAGAAQASRRMSWDHAYQHAISQRGF
jgi:hypothetical protein